MQKVYLPYEIWEHIASFLILKPYKICDEYQYDENIIETLYNYNHLLLLNEKMHYTTIIYYNKTLSNYYWNEIFLSASLSTLNYIIENKLHPIIWTAISENKNAIPILLKNIKKIDFSKLSYNSNSTEILIKYPEYIDWLQFSFHVSDIDFIRKHLDKLDYSALSSNPHAIPVLKENMHIIDWYALSANYNAIDILIENMDKIKWKQFCRNTSPKIIPILRKNMDKIDWIILSKNPVGIELLKENPVKIRPLSLCGNPSKEAFDMIRLVKEKLTHECYFEIINNPNFVELDNKEYNKLITNFVCKNFLEKIDRQYYK